MKREIFEADFGNVGFAIFEYLLNNKDNAYNVREISNAIRVWELNLISLSLAQLVNKRLAEFRYLDGELYFAISKEVLDNLDCD